MSDTHINTHTHTSLTQPYAYARSGMRSSASTPNMMCAYVCVLACCAGLACGCDGMLLASLSHDKTVKVLAHTHIHAHTHTHTHTQEPSHNAHSKTHLSLAVWCDMYPQVYDVLNFDMIVMLRLPYVPGCCEWIYKVR